MIVSSGEAAGAVFGEAGETVAHALTDRFKSLKAGGGPRGIDADTLGGTVVDRGTPSALPHQDTTLDELPETTCLSTESHTCMQ
jgi:hypothetical protein